MAGFTGILGTDASPDRVAAMLTRLGHRGPDHHWSEQQGACALGVCSADLSQDRGTGHATDGQAAIVFDGEIYNDRPAGTSDAEVALGLYWKHGNLFAAHLKGAFACAVSNNGEVVLARDAVGIRPVYWGRNRNGSLYFASECKSLVGAVGDVREVPPATVYSSRSGLQPYLPVHPAVEVPADVEDAKAALRETLVRATQRRLADGAVGGMLLSGGLDSSIIAAIATQLQPGIPAFTVGVEGAPDIENAAVMAEHLGVEHRVKIFGKEEIKALIADAVYTLESFDEDCVSGTIANMVASGWAATVTNCILSGEGGDELNGGYLMLKELPDEESRQRCMEKLIEVAYNTALQRLDRAMMRHSIHYRTPFLDSDVIAFCLQMPTSWKVHERKDGTFVEKWLLREAFRDMLPDRIYRREKLRFSGGTGTDPVIDAASNELIASSEFTEQTRQTPGGYRLNSPKELHYYRIFKERFPEPCFESLVGRWDPAK